MLQCRILVLIENVQMSQFVHNKVLEWSDKMEWWETLIATFGTALLISIIIVLIRDKPWRHF